MNTNEDTNLNSGSVSRRYSQEEREGFIQEYEQSGMTQQAFAKERGLALSTFLSWLGKHRRPGTNKKPATSATLSLGREGTVRETHEIHEKGAQVGQASLLVHGAKGIGHGGRKGSGNMK